MTDTTIGSAPATVPTDTSTVKVDKLKGTSLEGMAVQMMAAIIMLEVAQVKKKEAELKIAEMKAQNDRARAINDFLDKIRSKIGGITKDETRNKLERGEILANHLDEARALGIDTSGWGVTKDTFKEETKKSNMRSLSEELKKVKKQKEACKDLTADGMQKIYAPIQHAAENCNSDNQTMMVKLQDFMGQYNSYVSGASDQIKQANQTSLKLAKRE